MGIKNDVILPNLSKLFQSSSARKWLEFLVKDLTCGSLLTSSIT